MKTRGMSVWHATWLVARKELVASFRDKQTTLYTIVVPLLLYPFLFWAMVQGALFVQGRAEHTQVRLGVAAAPGASLPAELPSALSVDPPDPARARRAGATSSSATSSSADESSAAEISADRENDQGKPQDLDTAPRDAGAPRSASSDGDRTHGGPGADAARDGTMAPNLAPDDRASTETSSGTASATGEGAPASLPARMHVTTRGEPLDEAGARAWLAESRANEARAGEDDPNGPPDAVLLLHATPSTSDAPNLDPQAADLFYDSTQSRSQIARRRVEKRLPAFAGHLREGAAARLGYDPATLQPFVAEDGKDIAAEERGGGYFLSLILPMLLVVMTVIGAFYPAVDFTAGERERNTAETTALLPVPRRAVHQGKILAVCACAVLATSLNLLALGFSAEHLLNMMRADGDFDVVVPVAALVSIAPLAILFAFFVSAVLTGCAALARTFKEGQALLGPVQLVFMFPAMAGAMPGLELTPTLSLVPVVNVVLAFRALLKGQSLPLEYALTATSLFVMALVAVWLALRVLSRESLVSSGRALGFLDLVSVLRSRGSSR